MDTKDGSIKENTLKVRFDPTDTIYDVQARVSKKIAENRNADMPSGAIKIAKFILKVPGLTSCIVWLLRFLDRYGIMPGFLIDELPFYTGLWLTNNASIGLKSVYTISIIWELQPVFCYGYAGSRIHRGRKRQSSPLCKNSVGVTVDERVCAGATFAKMFTIMRTHLKNPKLLETPPEIVYYNEGAEYHEPKPEGVNVQA